ncbi:MAG TPA: hypothetical protein C5S50_10545 [Methanosarcinaceae archaeon]|nr:hypothetical protein [Methanosarcinaceae archaeon]
MPTSAEKLHISFRIIYPKNLENHNHTTLFPVCEKDLFSNIPAESAYHSKDMRIETHVILVVFGYLLLSLLRVIKPRRELEAIFRALKIKTPKFDVKKCIPTNFDSF